jgi:acetolactate synthase I/II/III large subunit
MVSPGFTKYFPEGTSVKTNSFYGDVIEPTPDYWKIAEAFDGYGERVEETENLQAALDRGIEAVNQGRLAVIDVILEP